MLDEELVTKNVKSISMLSAKRNRYDGIRDYRKYFRMSEGTFDKLLRMVGPFWIRKDTNMRESSTYIFSSLSKALSFLSY
jgi:hypothetical protein